MEETIKIDDLREICMKLNQEIKESSNKETIIFSQAEYDKVFTELFIHNYLAVN